jgi:hypothetical protein
MNLFFIGFHPRGQKDLFEYWVAADDIYGAFEVMRRDVANFWDEFAGWRESDIYDVSDIEEPRVIRGGHVVSSD